MKLYTLTLTPDEAAMIRDAAKDAAIALRTDRDTHVVMSEKDFVNSDASPNRVIRYHVLAQIADDLADFVRKS